MRLDLLDVLELVVLIALGVVIYRRARGRPGADHRSGGVRPRFVMRSLVIFLGALLLLATVLALALSRGG